MADTATTPPKLTLAQRLRRTAKARGLSAEDLEFQLGVSPAMLFAWDSGVVPPLELATRAECWMTVRRTSMSRFAQATAESSAAAFFGKIHQANLRSHRSLLRLNEDNDESLSSARETYQLCLKTKIPDDASPQLLEATLQHFQRVGDNLRTMLNDIERLENRTAVAVGLARRAEAEAEAAVA